MSKFEEFFSQLDEKVQNNLRDEKLLSIEELVEVPREDLRSLGLKLGDLARIDKFKKELEAATVTTPTTTSSPIAKKDPNVVSLLAALSSGPPPPPPQAVGEDSQNGRRLSDSHQLREPPAFTVATDPSHPEPTVSENMLDEILLKKKGLSVNSAEFQPSGNTSTKAGGGFPQHTHHQKHHASPFPRSNPMMTTNTSHTSTAGFAPNLGAFNPHQFSFAQPFGAMSAFQPPGMFPGALSAPMAPQSGMVMVQDKASIAFQPYHVSLLNQPGLILVDSKLYGEPELLPRQFRHRHDNSMTVVTICQLAPSSDPNNVVAMIQKLFQITIAVIHETEACFSVTGVPEDWGEKLKEAYPGYWTHVHRDGEDRWCVQLDETLSKMTPTDFQARLAQNGVQVASHNLHKRHRIIRVTVPVEDANRLCLRSRSLLQDRDGCFFVALDYQANNVLQQYSRWLSEPTRRDGLRDALLPCNPVVFELLHRFSGK